MVLHQQIVQTSSMSSHIENSFALYVQRIHCVAHDQIYVETLEAKVGFCKMYYMWIPKGFNFQIEEDKQ
jgi:hypothetical protein